MKINKGLAITILSVFLILIILVIGAYFGLQQFGINLTNLMNDTVQEGVNAVSTVVQEAVDKPQPLEKMPNGSIVEFGDYNFQVDGTLESITKNGNQMTVVAMLEDGTTTMSSFEEKTSNDYTKLVQAYMNGDKTLETTLGAGQQYTRYYYNYNGYDIPIIYNQGTGDWYSIVVMDHNVVITTSRNPIILSDGIASKVYRKASETATADYDYNSYQTKAIENTRMQSGIWTPPNESDDDFDDTSVSENETYTNYEDLQKVLTTYDHNKLQSDGTIEGTDIKITTTTDDDKTYDYNIIDSPQLPEVMIGGLKLNNFQINYLTPVSGVKTFMGLSTEVPNSIDVTNADTVDREFVIMLKFVSEDDKLLDFILIDNLDDPLAPNETRTFPISLSTVKNSGVLRSVQFKTF